MKKISLLILLFLFASVAPVFSGTPTSSECLKFHTGKFYIKGDPETIIVRDEKFQTETVKNGDYMKMSVTWTSDCTYELRLVKTNSKEFKRAWRRMKVLTVTITQCYDNSYRFSATSKKLPTPIIDTMVKIADI